MLLLTLFGWVLLYSLESWICWTPYQFWLLFSESPFTFTHYWSCSFCSWDYQSLSLIFDALSLLAYIWRFTGLLYGIDMFRYWFWVFGLAVLIALSVFMGKFKIFSVTIFLTFRIFWQNFYIRNYLKYWLTVLLNGQTMLCILETCHDVKIKLSSRLVLWSETATGDKYREGCVCVFSWISVYGYISQRKAAEIFSSVLYQNIFFLYLTLFLNSH